MSDKYTVTATWAAPGKLARESTVCVNDTNPETVAAAIRRRVEDRRATIGLTGAHITIIRTRRIPEWQQKQK